MRVLPAIAATLILAAPGACSDSLPGGTGPGTPEPGDGTTASVVVTVDTTQRFQTMTGWEGVAEVGQSNPASVRFRQELLDKVVNELGINRIRVHLRSGSENTIDYYVRLRTQTFENERCERWLLTNDNSDPSNINFNGFHFSEIDTAMATIILPMRTRLAARGEKLYLNLNYVAFTQQCPAGAVNYIHADPNEYAEAVLATFLHMKSRYGFVPDAVEMILEPDNGQLWNGTKIGNALVRTAAVLAANGFRPAFIGPSTMSMANAVTFSEDMFRVPGVAPLISEIAYHRYGGVSDDNLRALASLAKQYNTKTAMLEHIASDVNDLYADLTIGNASAWQQFTLGLGAPDGGGQYYRIIDSKPVMGSRTRYLRQYFYYVRFGARRVGASSGAQGPRVTAFQNQNGRQVVVIHTNGTESIEVRGLKPGPYGATITTETLTGYELGERTVSDTSPFRVTSRGEGVLTVYAK